MKKSLKTLVLGASTNPERYAFIAANRLLQHGHEIELVGIKSGEVAKHTIHIDKPQLTDIDTVTMYIGTKNQADWYEYIESLKPRRVIFNPGTENAAFEERLANKGIDSIEACTLVMLSVGTY
jgi:uncharacterized protein